MTCQGDAYANESITILCAPAHGKPIMKYRWENWSAAKKETGFRLGHAKNENPCPDA